MAAMNHEPLLMKTSYRISKLLVLKIIFLWIP